MRRPRLLESLVLVGGAFVAGGLLARVRRPRASPPLVVVDAAPEASVEAGPYDAPREADAAEAEVAPGFTVDDDELPFTPPDSTDPAVLAALVPLGVRDEASLAAARALLGPYIAHANQGNPAITTHSIDRATCKARLQGVVLQTPLDRKICGGPFEVAIHHGAPDQATTCIDVFEFPNRPCVVPFVYSYALVAAQLCGLTGKRLCTQEEWTDACEADPKGGAARAYAYGDALDLEACHTGKTRAASCDVDKALWASCPTETAPSGSYPRCRSRLGVFDQHGNVAEAMIRREAGVNYVQLKGSAWFYDGKMYPDTCRFDPRWHVDTIDRSFHTNYHLGFRCCRSVVPLAQRSNPVKDAGAPEIEAAVVDEDPYASDDAGGD